MAGSTNQFDLFAAGFEGVIQKRLRLDAGESLYLLKIMNVVTLTLLVADDAVVE